MHNTSTTLSSFRKFLTTQSILCEGGNAVAGVSRIPQTSVPATLESIYAFLGSKCGINKSQISTLGSTNKKKPNESSGDIDLMVDCSKEKTDLSAFQILLVKKITPHVSDIKSSIGFHIISFAFPITGSKTKELVQVDLMLSKKPEWTQFSFHSPHSKDSKYKAIVLKRLMISLASNIDRKVIATAKDTNGKTIPVTFDRYIFNNDTGLFRVRQSFVDQSNPKKITNTKKTLSKKFVTDDPDKIAKIFLGKNFDSTDFYSFETLMDAIKSPKFAYPELRNNILKDAKSDILENEGINIL